LDVTRTRIRKPITPKNKINALTKLYWSEKDKFHAWKYEIMVSLGRYPKIVYFSGPYPGSIHDYRIARNCSLTKLNPNEKVCTDPAYKDKKRCMTYKEKNKKNKFYNKKIGDLRLNVERMNQRIKIFSAARRWRGKRHQHKYFFRAICYITNLELECQPLSGDLPERDDFIFEKY
jgi:hypothetical protein